jgi:hypothetical protein
MFENTHYNLTITTGSDNSQQELQRPDEAYSLVNTLYSKTQLNFPFQLVK